MAVSWGDLRQNIKNHWDIETDEKLFASLESFAERLISRSHDLSNSANELIKEAINAEVDLTSAMNNLNCLSSSQFIANRIKEEDINAEDEANESRKNSSLHEQDTGTMTLSDARMTKAKNRETREASLVPKFKEAMELGLKGLRIAEMLEQNEGDVTRLDGEIGDNMFYAHRRLPHVINTSHFIADAWVGLYEDLDQTVPDVSMTMDQTILDTSVMEGSSDVNSYTSGPPPSLFPPPEDEMKPPAPLFAPPPGEVMTQAAPPMQATNIPAPPQMPTMNAPPPPPMPVTNAPAAPPLPPAPSGRSQTVAKPPKKGGNAKDTFMQGFAQALAQRKRIIDGEIEGDLSVKAVRNQEVEKLGIAPTIIPGVDTPDPNSNVNRTHSMTAAGTIAPMMQPQMMMPPPAVKKNPDEMTMAEKRAMLGMVMGAPPQMMAPAQRVEEQAPAAEVNSMPQTQAQPVAMPPLPQFAPPQEQAPPVAVFQQPPAPSQPAAQFQPPQPVAAPPVAPQPVLPQLPAFDPPAQKATPPPAQKKTAPGLFDMPNIDDEESDLDTTFKKNRPSVKKQEFGDLFAAPERKQPSLFSEPTQKQPENRPSATLMSMLAQDNKEDEIDLLNDSNPFLFAKEDLSKPKTPAASKPAPAASKPAPAAKPSLFDDPAPEAKSSLFDDPLGLPAAPVREEKKMPAMPPMPMPGMEQPIKLPTIGGPSAKPKPAQFSASPVEESEAQKVQNAKPMMAKRPPKRKKTPGMFEETKKDSGNPFFMNATKSTPTAAAKTPPPTSPPPSMFAPSDPLSSSSQNAPPPTLPNLGDIAPPKKSPPPQRKMPTNPLFDDDDIPALPTATRSPKPDTKILMPEPAPAKAADKPKPATGKVNLFADDDEDEDFFKSSKRIAKKPKRAFLFDDSD